MLVPDEATCFWDVAGWAGCGEAELVPVGRGREYKEGEMEENRKTGKKKKREKDSEVGRTPTRSCCLVFCIIWQPMCTDAAEMRTRAKPRDTRKQRTAMPSMAQNATTKTPGRYWASWALTASPGRCSLCPCGSGAVRLCRPSPAPTRPERKFNVEPSSLFQCLCRAPAAQN